MCHWMDIAAHQSAELLIQLTVLFKVLHTYFKLHVLCSWMMDIKDTRKLITLHDMICNNQIITTLDIIDCYKN